MFDFSADGVQRSLEASLERLGLDRVDIVHVHDPDDHANEALAGAFPALRRWRDEGVVGAIGAGMNQAPMLARFVREAGLDCVLLAGRYTLLDQSGLDELLPLCEREGVSVIAAGVFNSGLLANPTPGAPFDYAPAPAERRRAGATAGGRVRAPQRPHHRGGAAVRRRPSRRHVRAHRRALGRRAALEHGRLRATDPAGPVDRPPRRVDDWAPTP